MQLFKRPIRSRRKWLYGLGAMFLAATLFLLLFPSSLFDDPYATIIEDANGELLSAQIADDGQWRFPEADSIPEKLEQSILFFEDEYFRYHPGINPVSTFRALWQNIRFGKVVSGGSTLSMQVIRLSRKGKARSYGEKLLEMYLALRMEATYSKDEILQLYVSHAPYGGNVVGAEAAAWRYFRRPLHRLSWAETAMLAVLPNSPALIHPGRNRRQLKDKRDRLLDKLCRKGVIDSTTFNLSILEQIPEKPNPLPQNAIHLLNFAVKSGFKGKRVNTTVSSRLQNQLSQRLDHYVTGLSQNNVHNACAMIVSVETGNVMAYVGNAGLENTPSGFVDIIQSPRSSGSILKPLLYAAAVEEGLIHTESLLPDIPFTTGNFSPTNFDQEMDGMVAARHALTRSLNIPASLLLRDYGLQPFYNLLRSLDFSTIDRPPAHYGLTLILGGAEVTLWDLAKAYNYQAQDLKDVRNKGMKLWSGEKGQVLNGSINKGAWWLISNALTEVQRPELEQSWKRFSSSRRIAWKTGTSYGYRDAWAIGYDAGYLVAVWVGNADGEGRPGLTGVSTAAPLMFEAFGLLDKGGWFEKPYMDLEEGKLCAISGMSPSRHCPQISVEFPEKTQKPAVCSYHVPMLVNKEGKRVFRDCAGEEFRDTIWFSLPPVQAYYYGRKHSGYKSSPPLATDCADAGGTKMAIIYPQAGSLLTIPRDFDGDFEDVRLEATHFQKDALLFWHLDDRFIGSTRGSHKLTVAMEEGPHKLMVMDEEGNSAGAVFRAKRG